MESLPAGLRDVLALLEPLLAAETLEDARARAVGLAAAASGAEVVGLFLVAGNDTGAESWIPSDEVTLGRFRPHLRGLALETLSRGVPVATPFPPGVGSGLEPAVLPLVDRGRTVGMLCLACRPGMAARCELLVPVVAREIAEHQDAVTWQMTKTRYERWFKQFDQQMRVLERERQKFAALVNQTDTYVFVADPTGIIRWVSRGMAGRFPAPGESGWIGRPCDEVWTRMGCPTGAVSATVCPVARAQSAAQSARQEFRLDEGGSVRNFCVTALPVRDPDGRVREVLVVAQDLTDLETVRRAELGLRSVVSSAPVVLFAVDQDGIFRLSEGRGLETLGLAPGEVVGVSAFEFYKDQPLIVESLRRSLAGEEFTELVEVGPLAFETRFTPQRDGRGRVVGMVGVATDVSERRRLEHQLRESQQVEAVGRFARDVGHEFSDLLAVIMGNNELVLGRLQAGHPLRQPAEEVQLASLRGAQLIRRLLALSRAEGVTPDAADAAGREAA